MNIIIATTPGVAASLLQNVHNLLGQHQGYFVFICQNQPLDFTENEYEWDSFFAACNAYRENNEIPGSDFLIVLTELNNRPNWFSMFSTEERTVFIHVSGWENYIYAEPEYPVAYQTIENILQRLSYEQHGESFISSAHANPIGCMNDMCGWKPDVQLKLRTADICEGCLKLLEAVPDYRAIIQHAITLFESLRLQMVYTLQIYGNKSFEKNMPFPVAITRRKLSTTSEPLRKVLMLIDHFDSLIRMAVFIFIKLVPDTDYILVNNHLHDRPALGNWVSALAELARENQAMVDNLAGFDNALKDLIELAQQERIVNLRNELRGHNYINCQDDKYQEVFMRFLPVVNQVEYLLSGLFTRFKYYYVKQVNRIGGNTFTVQIKDLSGSDTAFIENELTTTFNDIDTIPCSNEVHLVTDNLTRWISLSPYFEYRRCNLCQHDRVLVYEGRYKLDPYAGHRFE